MAVGGSPFHVTIFPPHLIVATAIFGVRSGVNIRTKSALLKSSRGGHRRNDPLGRRVATACILSGRHHGNYQHQCRCLHHRTPERRAVCYSLVGDSRRGRCWVPLDHLVDFDLSARRRDAHPREHGVSSRVRSESGRCDGHREVLHFLLVARLSRFTGADRGIK